jgi:two-component system catabolic regulation response regulator CreB
MSASATSHQRAPYRVLIVEDDPLVARALARTLMRHGMGVDVIASCAEARLLDGHYDLGIFDIELPDGFGTNLARELVLRATIRGVVFYTGASYQPLLRRAWQLGEVVAKDSGVAPLLAAVESQLTRPRPRFDSGVLHEGDVIGFEDIERPTGSNSH